MCLENIKIKSRLVDYELVFESDSKFMNELITIDNAVFVIDKNVYGLYKDSLFSFITDNNIVILEISEEKKTYESIFYLYDKIMSYSPKKNLTIISIGGGITQDISGFVASTLYRGVKWIYLPTTLLAQSDSCIGGKTSLNYNKYKNLIGTFYPPTKIIIYSDFIKTLSDGDYFSGIGEIVKLYIIDEFGKNNEREKLDDLIDNFKKVEDRDSAYILNSIRNTLLIKKSFIEEDEFDSGVRNTLNYGHCIGHAIEVVTNYSVPHGQAVILGMIYANKLSVELGMLSSDVERYLHDKIFTPALKIHNSKLDISTLIDAMKQDKKNTGSGLTVILLKDNYEFEKVSEIKFELIEKIFSN